MFLKREVCVFLAHRLFNGEITGKELVEEIKRRESIQIPLFGKETFKNANFFS